MEFERRSVEGRTVNVYETPRFVMGFTEIDFTLADLKRMFSAYRPVELKQTHSDQVYFGHHTTPGTEGDGIIVDQPGQMAIIKTADCTPLFFWDEVHPLGGVVHVGWKGLLKTIEKKLTEKLTPLKHLRFFLGPAIEKNCYEVGQDLYELFSDNVHRDAIFSPRADKDNKYLLDIRQGIRLSLMESGVPATRIKESPLCTYCENKRFPSYRRRNQPGHASPHTDPHARIYNFLALK